MPREGARRIGQPWFCPFRRAQLKAALHDDAPADVTYQLYYRQRTYRRRH